MSIGGHLRRRFAYLDLRVHFPQVPEPLAHLVFAWLGLLLPGNCRSSRVNLLSNLKACRPHTRLARSFTPSMWSGNVSGCSESWISVLNPTRIIGSGPKAPKACATLGGKVKRYREPFGDLDILNSIGVSIADQRRTENQCDFRTAHVVMIASYRACRRPHYVNVVLSCQLCEREWFDNEPACVAGWSERFGNCLRKHKCVLRSLTRQSNSEKPSRTSSLLPVGRGAIAVLSRVTTGAGLSTPARSHVSSLASCYEVGVGDSSGCSSSGCSGDSSGVSSGVEVVIGSVGGCFGEIAGVCLGS